MSTLESWPHESYENVLGGGDKWPKIRRVGKRVGKQGQAPLRAPRKSWWLTRSWHRWERAITTGIIISWWHSKWVRDWVSVSMKSWLLALPCKTFIRELCQPCFPKQTDCLGEQTGGCHREILDMIVNSASSKLKEVILHRNAREL